MSGEIWLGDAATAIAALASDDDERRAILRLLGLAPTPRAEPVRESGPGDAYPAFQAPVPSTPGPAPADTTSPAPPAGDEPTQTPGDLPLLTPTGFEPPESRSWPDESLPRVDQVRLRALRPHEPLLAPRSTRALLGMTLSQPVPEGPIDSDALVEAISRMRPVDRLPRRPTRTLRFGVQVLVDLGAGMQPFARDQWELVDQLRRLFGQELTDVQQFAYAPLRGTGPGPRWTWTPYRPPPPATRVLVLSNFGIGGPPLDYLASDRSEWEEFVELVARHGFAATGFVPYPPTRWPAWLRSRLPLICWDRGTTVSKARSRPR